MNNDMSIVLKDHRRGTIITETVYIPSLTALAGAAADLKREYAHTKQSQRLLTTTVYGTYGIIPPYTTELVDIFAGTVEETAQCGPHEWCYFTYRDQRWREIVASATFDSAPPTVTILRPIITQVQGVLFAEEYSPPSWEGSPIMTSQSRYERDPSLRSECIRLHGARCAVCDLDFALRYGPHAAGFIHVHHLKPLASVGARHRVDPQSDLVPLCPNCHAVCHMRTPPYAPEEIRTMIGCM